MNNPQQGLAKVIGSILAPMVQSIVDPEHFGFVTIQHIKVTKDFDYADVYISAWKNREDLTPLLREHVYQFQQQINKKIQRKRVPKIRFFTDDTGEFTDRLEAEFKK